MRDGENLPLQLKRVVKSGIALKAIHHAISRVKQFNNQNNHFPLEIRSVGIGGSSIRSEDPNDIDLFVEAHAIQNIWLEWRKFKERLNSNTYELGKIAFDLGEIGGKATTSRMMETAKDRLLTLGFEKSWIENWLPWIRISDVRWGLNHGMPITHFSENELISRFIKDGWRGRRLEINVSLNFDLGKRSTFGDLPRVIIWRKEKGIVSPNEEDIVNFLQGESNELLKLSKKIIEIVKSEKEQRIWETPSVYHHTIRITKEKEKEEPFKNLKIEFKKLALSELDEIKKLIETDSKTELTETNTKLRGYLKRFALIGQVSDKIENLGCYELYRLLGTNDIYMTLSQILPKRLSRLGYPKKNIVELLRAVNWGALVRDLKRRERGK